MRAYYDISEGRAVAMIKGLYHSSDRKKFGGKYYYWHGHTNSKRDAKVIAKRAREHGVSARVESQKTKYGIVYNVWIR